MGTQMSYFDSAEEHEYELEGQESDHTPVAFLSPEDRHRQRVLASLADRDPSLHYSREEVMAEFQSMQKKKTAPAPPSTPKVSSLPSPKPTKKPSPQPVKAKKKPDLSTRRQESFAKLQEINRRKKAKEDFEKGIIKYYKGVKTSYLKAITVRREKERTRTKFKHFESKVVREGLGWGSTAFVSVLKEEFPNILWLAEPQNFNQPLSESGENEENITKTSSSTNGGANPPASVTKKAETTTAKTAATATTTKLPEAPKENATPVTKAPAVNDKAAKKGENPSKKDKEEKGKGGDVLKINKPESTEAKVDATKAKTDTLTKTGEELDTNSKSAYTKGLSKVGKTSRQVQKTEGAAKKVADVQKAVVPPKEEATSKANDQAITNVEKSPEPKLDADTPKQDVSKKMADSLPTTKEAVKRLSEHNPAKDSVDGMNKLIKKQTGDVKGNYQKIKDAPTPVHESAKQELPGVEAPSKVQALNLAEGMLPPVPSVQSDFTEYKTAGDDLIKNELQSPEPPQGI